MLNTIIVTGHLGGPPEFKQIGQKNTDLATFSIAVNQYNGPNKEDTTVWYDVNLWGGFSKFASDLQTGDRVTVLGTPKLDRWQDKDGGQRESWKIDAREIHVPKRQQGESGGTRTTQRSSRSAKKDDMPF